ncbi:MAG: hypothetical protein KBI09_11410 [Mesotoga sp.]|nr:hypothetical protein [Mesotoga sp.]
MGDNITASAAVSEASVSEIKDSEGVIAELEALKEALKAEIEELKAENEAFKKTIAELEKASSVTSGDKKPVSKPNTKPLFFDHDVLSDSGNVNGRYIPKTEAEYERLKPFAVEEK